MNDWNLQIYFVQKIPTKESEQLHYQASVV